MNGIYEAMVGEVPKLRRGVVWCVTCGNWRRVNAAYCLRNGWPKCCGATMTIDSPAERDAMQAQEAEG